MMKASIRNIVLGGVLAGLTAVSSVARAAEPVDVHQTPGVDLPPQLCAEVRAAIDDVLAGRAQPAVPIDVTLEAGGAVVRVGSLSRRIAILGWDYAAVRTVALHVLDLLQPGPEMPEVSAAATSTAIPTPEPSSEAAAVVEAPATERPSEQTTGFEGPLSVHLAVAGARGAQGPDPWMVSGTAGATWTRRWLRIGLEVGWDHGLVRHPNSATVTVNYDATPLRLVLAVQNRIVMAGVRGGVAVYRVATTQETFTEVTPLVGPFVAFKFPIAGRFRGLLMEGFDYFGRRTELSTGLWDTAYSSPQLAPYVAVVAETVLSP
jgi:hypothetical protein